MSSHDSRYPTNTSDGKLFETLMIAAVLLASVAVLSSYNAADPDLWGHVQYGRDLLRDGLPATTTYSYTAQGYRWINHENLSEVMFAVGADTIGIRGMLLVKSFLGLILASLMLLYSQRKRVGMIAAGGCVLLAMLLIGFTWGLRPQLFSYFYFGLMIALLGWCFEGWEGRWHLPWLRMRPSGEEFIQVGLSYSPRRLRWLWACVPLFFLWANTHGGFVAGFVLFAAYLLCRSVEALATRGHEGWGLVRRFLLMIAAGGCATLINPYGPGLHLWMVQSLGYPRPEITEWWPPELINLTDARILCLWTIIVLFCTSLLFSRRPRDLTQMVLLGLTFWQSMEHQRHLPFFAILFGFWMPPHVEGLLRRINSEQPGGALEPQPMSWPIKLGLGGVLCGVLVLLAGSIWTKTRDMPVPRSDFPVTAIEYLKQHKISGKMVVTYNWAQYVIAALGPKHAEDDGVLVGFDGRFRTCYPQEVVDMHFDFLIGDHYPKMRYRSPKSAPYDPTRVLEYKRPDLVLISRLQEHSTATMQTQRDDWILLYQDKLAQVWGARWKYGQRSSPDYIPQLQRHISNDPQQGVAAWPAVPESPLATKILAAR
ncbi:hypothetical protein [Lignipirellula cremea]|uniref:Uncharacterized protein n=1 Tax=Lignipirellula cremea TaxID=2528010 RepID=A0A518DS18_9BACT|nr:hypothetical protein [Lignipirellula cremea]QDU94640.1 hypothetical protein Pla8534_24330 [Lignipirellula cremea]